MKMKHLAFGIFLTLVAASYALAVPTQITVRVKSKGAKFIGTSMGGVLVTIKNAQTGELLAKGYTAGGTGNTSRIMTTAQTRDVPISDESAAKFTATIDIDEPTQVEVSAFGPLANLQAANRVSSSQWIVPGKPITEGDAWMLEMPGFAVDVLAPPTHSVLMGVPQEVTIRANVTMMCGCPITPGGLWDANKFEVTALLRRNGQQTGVLQLKYAGSASQFAANWNVKEPGTYQATVYAYDPSTGNTGLDSVTFMVGK